MNLTCHTDTHTSPHIPRTQVQEAPAVLCYVLTPCLGSNHVEEARVPAQLLSEHWPEGGLGAQHLQAPDACVNAALLHMRPVAGPTPSLA